MTSFYRNLRTAPIEAEALRQAQVAMLQGKVFVKNGQTIAPLDRIDLPATLAQGDTKLTHPFYWAGLTIVGNPW
jgi:CHAT domain-containing protein